MAAGLGILLRDVHGCTRLRGTGQSPRFPRPKQNGLSDQAAMTHSWWQTGVIYQIYPRSFQDANGDGVGDLKGITALLDYLKDFGVDAIWISPIFVSPMADFGYDVADYRAIDPLFGTLEDFDALVEKAHGLGLKIILDLVPNH